MRTSHGESQFTPLGDLGWPPRRFLGLDLAGGVHALDHVLDSGAGDLLLSRNGSIAKAIAVCLPDTCPQSSVLRTVSLGGHGV
jgi:hypothetical protein